MCGGRASRRSSWLTAMMSCTFSRDRRRAAIAMPSTDPDAFLLFGRESRGLDQAIIDARADRCRRIPMREGARSLNLSNAVAIAAYEALAQQGFPGLV